MAEVYHNPQGWGSSYYTGCCRDRLSVASVVRTVEICYDSWSQYDKRKALRVMNVSTLVQRRSPLGCFPGQSAPRLYDRVVEVPRARHYSPRTEDAYVHRIRRFTLFHAGAHPRELAVKKNVAASTQNQALAALLFLFLVLWHVLEQTLNRIEGVIRARKPKRLPVVLTSDEVEVVLARRNGVPSSVCTLLRRTTHADPIRRLERELQWS